MCPIKITFGGRIINLTVNILIQSEVHLTSGKLHHCQTDPTLSTYGLREQAGRLTPSGCDLRLCDLYGFFFNFF